MKTNSAPPVDRLQPDIDLVVFDFAGAYAEQPEDALACLELLVKDRHSCLGRIALLRVSAGTTGQPFPGRASAPGLSEFAAEIDLLAEGRLFDDFLEGRLSDERIARLHRLTCDSDALWAAHVRCRSALPDNNGSTAAILTPSATETAVSFTQLAQTPARWQELAKRLRPWLPFLLDRAGLSPDLVPEALSFIQDRLPGLGGRRFRDVLPGWVAEFARQQGHAEPPGDLGAQDWRDLIAVGAVMLALERVDDGAVAWVGAYREHARKQRPRSPAALRDLPLPSGLVDDPALPVFRRGLGLEAERYEREGLCLFEVA